MKEKKKDTEEGIVLEALPDLLFRVQILNGRIVKAKLAGKLRMHHIKVLAGDKVTVELTPYDPERGRIVWREK